ncbi:helix-turn-helix domain-containing protein, partial [Candidatus Poribacteria bacterium]
GNVRELENCIERAIVMGDGDTIRSSDLPASICRNATLFEPGQIMNEMPSDDMSLDQLEESIMKRHIIRALRQTGGNQTQAAKMLGIQRRKLQYRMDKYGISASDFADE